MITRSKSGITKFNPKYALAATVQTVTEPKTIKEALAHPGQLEAMNEELKALEKTKHGHWVSKQSEMSVISTKWVFKIKYNVDNSIFRG